MASKVSGASQKKINAIWRHLGKGTLIGVSLNRRVEVAFDYFGVPMPKNREEQRLVLRRLLALNTVPAVKPLAPKPATPVAPVPADFYASWEWKKARYEVIKKHGRRCQCCGWRPGDTDLGFLVVDHIKPLALFPALALNLSNLQVLCNDCNMGKGRKHRDDFRGQI